jgi:SAM-dependent methyltransferase
MGTEPGGDGDGARARRQLVERRPRSLAGVAGCAICSGELVLRHSGSGLALDSELLSPTNHRPGEYGDIYRCVACGTLQQLSVPDPVELARLYRRMRDDAYLTEEAGRRRTACRILDVLGRHTPPGRLLDVGCGHGLLLDEARRLGWEVEGVEVSESAAAYAREALGLDVHEIPIEDLQAGDRRFDAVVLADVLEHLSDPVAALGRCRRLLNPGGVVCVVTPDPSSPVARIAGQRWWGLLPAHTFLLPRATLRGLLQEHGFAIAEDASLVRSFSLGYWLAGFAERGGRLATAVGGARRVLPGAAIVSIPLGDERVMVGATPRSARVQAAPAAPPRSRSRRATVAHAERA